ncbi:hypothetical protein L1049_002517 [Liquidambar formosana]|uniref:Uncharacterized protein n=1 Tax=Liquidambar formosana TaxID=63359 RepID=A0AAP0R9B7_LIQFO
MIVGLDAQLTHLTVEKNGTMILGAVDEASDHDVPEEDIWGLGCGEEGIGVRYGAEGSVLGDEIGGEEEVEVQVGSEHGGVKAFESFEGRTLLDQSDAGVWFDWSEKSMRLFCFCYEKTRVVVQSAATLDGLVPHEPRILLEFSLNLNLLVEFGLGLSQ